MSFASRIIDPQLFIMNQDFLLEQIMEQIIAHLFDVKFYW